MNIELNTILDIEKLPVTIKHIGENNSMDMWSVTINAGTPFTTTYCTGFGHRKAVRYAPRNTYKRGTVAYANWEKEFVKPVKPSVASVMYCLLLDASAAGSNFHDWCDMYGYDTDSRSALETYEECLKIAKGLVQSLGRSVMNRLTELLHDADY